MRMRGAYVASKFALEGYTDTLRVELQPAGISVSAIEPGPIESRIGENAIRAIHRHLDLENSVHREHYKRRLVALEKGGNTLGQLGPEAVFKALVHACESRRPKPRYFVTLPTHGAGLARRFLSGRMLHSILMRAR